MTALVHAGRGIVTPQGVVLDLEVAGVAYRAMARLLDLGVLLTFIGIFTAIVQFAADTTTANIVILIMLLVALFGYPAIAETYWRGRTIGKSALGLRVVTLEGGPIGFREAFIRSLFQLIDLGTLGVAPLITAMATDRSQRLGDLAAGTMVIRDPRDVAHVPAVPFTPPMGAEAMVASLDVARLRPEQERVIRSFLLRVGQLSKPVRADLGHRLAQSTANRLGHNPAGIGDPEVYLVAVMAARQLREGGLVELAIDAPQPRRRRGLRR